MGIGQALSTDEGDVRTAHSIGIARDLESRIAGHDLADSRDLHMVAELERELSGHPTMLIARWLAHDEDAAYELDPLLGNMCLQQLLSGHEARGHVGNVSVLGGHRQAIW